MKSCQYCINQHSCTWYINYYMGDVMNYMSYYELDKWWNELARKAKKCKNYREE